MILIITHTEKADPYIIVQESSIRVKDDDGKDVMDCGDRPKYKKVFQHIIKENVKKTYLVRVHNKKTWEDLWIEEGSLRTKFGKAKTRKALQEYNRFLKTQKDKDKNVDR